MIKKVFFTLIFSLGIYESSWAESMHVHASHNMILFGKGEVFASHIVYKKPHNYQVILSLNLDLESQTRYLDARTSHPDEQFIFLLDPMDIKDIAETEAISGTVFYVDDKDQNHEVIANLTLTKDNFKLIYFNELPLSLDRQVPLNVTLLPFAIKCDDSDIGKVPSCTPQPKPCSHGQRCPP